MLVEEGGGSRKGKEKGRKGEKRRKERVKRKKRKKNEKKERKRKEAGGFFLNSSSFRRSELVRPRNKFLRFDEGLRFKRYGFFLLWFISNIRAIVLG